MQLKPLTDKNAYNRLATHVVQSWEWGEFRKSLGLQVLRYGLYKNKKLHSVFQLTLHKIPLTNKYFGYLPKGPLPDKYLADALTKIAKENNCIAIKIEPNLLFSDVNPLTIDKRFKISSKPLFTKFNFIVNLDQSEDQLLQQMHPKTRYNIRVAQKHNVNVEERVDDEAFELYLKLYFETTKRQNYHGHSPEYHKKMWQLLKPAGIARIMVASYQPSQDDPHVILNTWILFKFKDVLYYPYGGSSVEYRNVMAPTLVAWEAIRLGKKLKCTQFDLWGALGPNADPDDPWQGFHRFKQGLGGQLVEYLDTYDLIINPLLYHLFTIIDKSTSVKVFLLKLLGK